VVVPVLEQPRSALVFAVEMTNAATDDYNNNAKHRKMMRVKWNNFS